MPKFSIITICYNEKLLEDTCKSIVNQTFQDFEWIVIDGGSDKETLDIFDKYKNRINYFVSEKDNGRYNAMNKGIKQAQGEYLNFMNAGDYFYDKNVLENIFKEIQKQDNFDIYYGNGYFDKQGEIVLDKKPSKLSMEFMYISAMSHQAMFFKRDLFNRFGYYDEQYKIVSDWKFCLQLMKGNCTFKYANIDVAIDNAYGISRNNITLNTLERKKVIEELLNKEETEKIENNLGDFIKDYNKELVKYAMSKDNEKKAFFAMLREKSKQRQIKYLL